MKRMLWWGVTLVVVGLWIWLSALGIPYMVFSRDWPLLLVALGVYIVARRARRHARRRRSAGNVITDLEAGKIDVDKAINEIRRSR
jgi:hypothetical protein